MYKLLYKLYFFKIDNKRHDYLFARIVVKLANTLLPIYFYCTNYFTNSKLSNGQISKNCEEYFVVSLTSFPKRIDKLWLCIETILRQEVKPNELILWLYEGEFKNIDVLPKKLLAQQKRGLQIRFCKENLMPHKKYYYAMQEYPNATVITIDDDIFLPSNLIKKLKEFQVKFPNQILCPIAMEIKIENNTILPYINWPYIVSKKQAVFGYLPIGAGSVLYPPNSLHKDLFDMNAIFKYCLKADDLWLKIMSFRQKTKILSMAGEFPRFYIPITFKNNSSLMDENIVKGKNDEILSSLLKYYEISPSDFKD